MVAELGRPQGWLPPPPAVSFECPPSKLSAFPEGVPIHCLVVGCPPFSAPCTSWPVIEPPRLMGSLGLSVQAEWLR
jgi:hypothetical protein